MVDPDRSKVRKRDADYTSNPTDAPPTARCMNCAHYIPGDQTIHGAPMCKVVRGQVSPRAVCYDFYADVGLFADNKLGNGVRLSMLLEMGNVGTWSPREAQVFLTLVERQMENLRS